MMGQNPPPGARRGQNAEVFTKEAGETGGFGPAAGPDGRCRWSRFSPPRPRLPPVSSFLPAPRLRNPVPFA